MASLLRPSQGLQWRPPVDTGGPAIVQYLIYRAEGVVTSNITTAPTFHLLATISSPANASDTVSFNVSTDATDPVTGARVLLLPMMPSTTYTLAVTARSTVVEGLVPSAPLVSGTTLPPIPCPNNCSGHGVCGSFLGVCTCAVGYGEASCDTLLGTPMTMFALGSIPAFNASAFIQQLAAVLQQPPARLLVFSQPVAVPVSNDTAPSSSMRLLALPVPASAPAPVMSAPTMAVRNVARPLHRGPLVMAHAAHVGARALSTVSSSGVQWTTSSLQDAAPTLGASPDEDASSSSSLSSAVARGLLSQMNVSSLSPLTTMSFQILVKFEGTPAAFDVVANIDSIASGPLSYQLSAIGITGVAPDGFASPIAIPTTDCSAASLSSRCGTCITARQCGWCSQLSTCVHGSSLGPAATGGATCPLGATSVFVVGNGSASALTPSSPTPLTVSFTCPAECSTLSSCSTCVGRPDCAWFRTTRAQRAQRGSA